MKKCFRTCALHTVLRANIALGILAFIGALYFLITGEYASLAMRQYVEGTLNTVAIGGLIYSVVFWYLDLYLNPPFPASES